MRPIVIASLVLFLCLPGCAEEPFTSSTQGDETSGEAVLAKGGATHSQSTLAFNADGWNFYLECLDETVTYFGTLDFALETVETPSGRTKTTWKGLYSYPYGFTSSGDHTWLMTHGTQTAQEVTTPDGAYSSHFSLHEWYENEVGDRLLQIGTYGLRLDSEGNLVSERFHGWCPGTPDDEYSQY